MKPHNSALDQPLFHVGCMSKWDYLQKSYRQRGKRLTMVGVICGSCCVDWLLFFLHRNSINIYGARVFCPCPNLNSCKAVNKILSAQNGWDRDPRNLSWGMIYMAFNILTWMSPKCFLSWCENVFWPENVIHVWKCLLDVKTLKTDKLLYVKIFLCQYDVKAFFMCDDNFCH